MVEVWLLSLNGQGSGTLVDWTSGSEEGEGEESGDGELHGCVLVGWLVGLVVRMFGLDDYEFRIDEAQDIRGELNL